ncbi:hypothetical protein HY501_02810 [Candidatus Woesearchaeota archaeon]|nr:hypothetical protein [Candidatus Woesearchaeota archaeon]
MVFARTKLVLEDNCFEEEPGVVTMKFVGPNVTKLYARMYEVIKATFRVPDSDVQETDYSWGKGKEKEKFKARWWVHKDMDMFTYLYVRFDISGEGNHETGNATVVARGLLRTEYPQDTVWQRSLFYEMLRTFWHRVFYHKKREEFGEECRHMTILFQKKIREAFEQLKKEA